MHSFYSSLQNSSVAVRENVNRACGDTFNQSLQNARAMSAEVTGFVSERLRKNGEYCARLAACRTPLEWLETQADENASFFSDLFDESTKLWRTYFDLFTQATPMVRNELGAAVKRSRKRAA